jgi:hypothetical protein
MKQHRLGLAMTPMRTRHWEIPDKMEKVVVSADQVALVSPRRAD